MPNADTRVARAFHEATKYVRLPGREGIFMGDPAAAYPALGAQSPANEPLPYKIYRALDPIPLPADIPPTTMSGLDALAATGEIPGEPGALDLAGLARLCLLSNGRLKTGRARGGRVIEYRAAGGTGARYHLEVYLVCGDLPDLPAGVYHYGAHDHRLRRLRSGDYRAALVEASGGEPAIAEAAAVVAVTSTFWRNAWRYQERAYRHVYWDAGVLLANLLALAAAGRLPARAVLGYADAAVNALLAVDGEREGCVALVALGRDGAAAAAAPAPRLDPLHLPIEPISRSEIDFPLIREMHRASALPDGAAAAAWRAHPMTRQAPEPAGPLTRLRPRAAADLSGTPIEAIIRRRRSVRHYDVERPLAFEDFSTLLERATRGVAMDCLPATAPPLHDQYLIVNNVADLPPGSYVWHPDRGALELLQAGEFRADASRLACDQWYPAGAHVNSYYLTDLEPVLERYGNRGYRLAQLQAAIYAGQLHLAAHALGLGAVGSTSFDDEVVDFFSPHAAGKSFMFVLVFGRRRARGAGA